MCAHTSTHYESWFLQESKESKESNRQSDSKTRSKSHHKPIERWFYRIFLAVSKILSSLGSRRRSKELWEHQLKICQILVFSIWFNLCTFSFPTKHNAFFFPGCVWGGSFPFDFATHGLSHLHLSWKPSSPAPFGTLEKFRVSIYSQWGFLLGIQSRPTEFRRSFSGQFWILKISESLEWDWRQIESLWLLWSLLQLCLGDGRKMNEHGTVTKAS